MTPSQEAKAAGLKNLKQVSEMIGRSSDTLINWHRNEPDLFRTVIAGCVARKDAYKRCGYCGQEIAATITD